MYAFVHIEKTGGTTLKHILRRAFFLRYAEVDPVAQRSTGWLCADDLRVYLRLNPFLTCISGHSVAPFADLEDAVPGIRYIGLIREPVSRYVSHYRHVVDRHGRDLTFAQFLKADPPQNYQTRRIAGTSDLSIAKERIARQFVLVGILEELDEFLVLLQGAFPDVALTEPYAKKNVASRSGKTRRDADEWRRYEEQIRDVNRLDLELYDFVRNEYLIERKERYGPGFLADVERLRRVLSSEKARGLRPALQKLIAATYYDPATRFVRRLRGVPPPNSIKRVC